MEIFVPKRAPSHRQKKVSEEVKHILAEALLRGDFPPLSDEEGNFLPLPPSITVIDVKVSPDFRQATVFVMPLGGQNQKETLDFLKTASPYLRTHLAKKLRLRVTPRLEFHIDKGLETAEKLQKLMSQSQSNFDE